MKNFINIADIDKKDLRNIIDNAKSEKIKRSQPSKFSLNTNGCMPVLLLSVCIQ